MADHFSSQAKDYARYRPAYPAALYERLLPTVEGRETAWDCGTGNGQVASVLAQSFDNVIATDLSPAQLAYAKAPANVRFAVASAEQSEIAPNSVDLITVGQAIHWFEREAFWQECRRVAKPNAVLAFWTYGLASAGLADGFERRFHSEIVGAYWPAGREHVDGLYADIHAPFPKLLDETLALTLSWSLEHYLGYLASWSATQKFRELEQHDPVEIARQHLLAAWGDGNRQIRWPLALKVYRVAGLSD